MTYQEAKALFKTAKNGRVKLDRNTYLERRGPQCFAVVLHSTDIVTITPQYFELRSGGWHTKTTMSRMSDYIPGTLNSWNRGIGWGFVPLADLPCYCTTGPEESIGKRFSENPDKPGEFGYFYPCPTCQGTLRRVAPDYDSGGHPYFEGMRIHPSGTRLLVKQPNAPKHWRPVRTESGW